MSVDKIYELLGTAFKRIFAHTIKRPVKNINVENRAYAQIDKKHTAAPWHDTTKKVVEDLKRSNNEEFKQMNVKNQNLVEQLKKLKVVSREYNSNEVIPDDKMPKHRFGADFPYIFYRPKEVPLGKVTVVDVLNIILSHKHEKTTVDEICKMYKIARQDAENLLKYVNTFKAINKDEEEFELYSKIDVSSDTTAEATESTTRPLLPKDGRHNAS